MIKQVSIYLYIVIERKHAMNTFNKLLAIAILTCTLGTITLGFSIFNTKNTNTMPVKNIIVIGTGAAGIGFIHEILEQKTLAHITWISSDNHNPYDRTKLDSVVSQEISENAPTLFDKKSNNIDLLLGKKSNIS